MTPLKRYLHTAAVLTVALMMMGETNCSEERRHSVQLMNEGIALAQARRIPEALEKLEEAGSVDPTNDAVFFNQAMLQLELQQPERAKAALERAITANDQRANYHEKLGTVLLQLEPPDLEGAQRSFERAVQLEPGLYKSHFKLAQVLERQGQEQAALERYTQAVRAGPRFAASYQELGRLYSDLGYAAQAVQVLRAGITSALPGTEDQAGLHHMLGVVYQQQRNYDNAIASFKAALQVQPGRPDTLFSLGWTYGLIENREEAVRYLQKFMEAATPETPATYTQAARERIAQLGGN
jgi:tetratricopeptide (TPR) repeat protein